MRGRAAEVAAVSALATVVTVALAAWVLRAPSERIFGMEIVGRHYDPFTVMEQFGRPIGVGVYSQPVTDIAGALLARVTGAVAAYNGLVLLSFPVSAAAAYLLARYLALSRAAATIAAMAYAFSPFHVAHAAYHLHIAQTQWMPLYVLALWRCLDRGSPSAIGWLGAAALAVALSNFYGGLIAAVITPVAVAAYWLTPRGSEVRSWRRLGITAGSLAAIAASGLAYAWYAARNVLTNPAAFAFDREDLFRYSAKWWSYLIPPVGHPLLGATVRRFWTTAGVHDGLLEQQVSLGWSIVALGIIAVGAWWMSATGRASSAPTSDPTPPVPPILPVAPVPPILPVPPIPPFLPLPPLPPSLTRVPILVIVAVAALVCSLSPERTIGTVTFSRPSALLYNVVPMFRAYARFGLVVQLMAALLAGIGIDRLHSAATMGARTVCIVLVTLAAGEYVAWPPSLWRDVLPTTAHRWITRQPGRVLALDCTPLSQESESVQWLSHYKIMLLGNPIGDCTGADLSLKLAASGFTHLLVRRDSATGQEFENHPAPDNLRVVARFPDSAVYAVSPREAP